MSKAAVSDCFVYDDVVRFHEVDADERLKVTAVLQYMQEAAAGHSHRAGDGFADQLKRGTVWVLRRLHLSMDRYPRWRNPIRIETWSVEIGRYSAVRDFRMEAAGVVFGAATTQWGLMDVEKRKPIRIPEGFEKGYGRRNTREIDDPFRPLPDFKSPQFSCALTVRRGDVNRVHLSNAIAAELCLESLPAEAIAGRQLHTLEVAYRKEGFCGDKVVSESAEADVGRNEKSFLHRTIRHSDNEITTLARSSWKVFDVLQ